MPEDSYPYEVPQSCVRVNNGTPILTIRRGETGADASEETAGFGIRGLAASIDRLILSTIEIGFFMVAWAGIKTSAYLQSEISPFSSIRAIFVLTSLSIAFFEIAYYTYFHTCTGQTIGKMVCGIKVVDIQGKTISFRRALCRWMGFVLSSFPLSLGLFWVAVDRAHQGWHDKIARTLVVKV
jgi:uncharacterized RDD family membrane protein YckC